MMRLLALATLLCFGFAGSSIASTRPNIVVIMADDLTPEIAIMGSNTRRIAFGGFQVARAYTSIPLCSPSRTSFLTGQYPHNHHVLGNRPYYGGYQTYKTNHTDDSTVFTWLHDAGYYTGLVGKFLNGWTAEDSPPKGLDEWDIDEGSSYVRYRMNENGRIVAYGDDSASYATHVEMRQAVDFLDRQKMGEPFFLTVATRGVHSGDGICPSEYADRVTSAQYFRRPSFNAVATDAPSFMAALPSLTVDQVEAIDRHHRERLCAFEAVDRLVGAVLDTLQKKGFEDNTYVIFTSDHGFHQGEHRIFHGKSFAYDHDTRIPLYVTGPGVVPGTVHDLVLMTDLPVTIAALAGVPTDDGDTFVDGRSFASLLFDEEGDGPPRNMFLISRYENETIVPGENPWPERMDAIRVMDPNLLAVYTYKTNEWELYFLDKDPYAISNVANEYPALVAELKRHMDDLAVCHGDLDMNCFDAENARVDPAVISEVLYEKL